MTYEAGTIQLKRGLRPTVVNDKACVTDVSKWQS